MAVFPSDALIERWKNMTIAEQFGNIGSEVDRAFSWKRRGSAEFAHRAFDRSLALIDLTLADSRWTGGRLREIARTREFLCDMFLGENVYGMTEEYFSRYFLAFARAARMRGG